LKMNIHTVFRFNENSQVESTLQYLDRSLIADAIRPKVASSDSP
jgi:hypothetical protein